MKFIKRLLLDDKFILFLIIINAVIIFTLGFHLENDVKRILTNIDNFITVIFFFEIVVKLREFGYHKFIQNGWNIFDTLLIIIAIPSMYFWIFGHEAAKVEFFLIFRVARVFKFLRLIRYFPNINHVILGIQKALNSSIVILAGLMIFNFMISVLSCFLYRDIAPDYFGNPFISFYSIFKIFTIEGWYEIPDVISSSTNEVVGFFTKLYFMIILLTGGIFGFSIVNSIFVDAMVSDNNDDLEAKIESLEKKIDRLLEKQ